MPWIEPGSGPNFREQIQYRNATLDHLHAVIPGHRFDTHIDRHLNHPIRKASVGDRYEMTGLDDDMDEFRSAGPQADFLALQ